jgi:hypothetical protein
MSYTRHLESRSTKLEQVISDAYAQLRLIINRYDLPESLLDTDHKDMIKDLYRLQTILENETTYTNDIHD